MLRSVSFAVSTKQTSDDRTSSLVSGTLLAGSFASFGRKRSHRAVESWPWQISSIITKKHSLSPFLADKMVIGVNDILDCVECNTPSGKDDIEDLIRQQRAKHTVHNNDENSISPTPALVHLLIDVETTLERLYGGTYSDWLAGGEWSHLYTYILSLLKPCQDLSLCLIFCFDGTLYRHGQSQWYAEQIQQRKKVNQIFKHLKQNRSGVPRRHLWSCPPAFQLCLRLILRELSSPHLLMHQTWGYGQGQHQEQLKSHALQYQHSLLGIVSGDLEFLIPTKVDDQTLRLRYFSSKHFKLSLKGKLTLMEVTLNQLKDKFALNDQQLSLLFALLGNSSWQEFLLWHPVRLFSGSRKSCLLRNGFSTLSFRSPAWWRAFDTTLIETNCTGKEQNNNLGWHIG